MRCIPFRAGFARLNLSEVYQYSTWIYQKVKDLFVTITGGWGLLSLSHTFSISVSILNTSVYKSLQAQWVCDGRGWNGCVGRKAPLWSAWFRGTDLVFTYSMADTNRNQGSQLSSWPSSLNSFSTFSLSLSLCATFLFSFLLIPSDHFNFKIYYIKIFKSVFYRKCHSVVA